MAALNDPAAYLAEHYVYEINMLRWTHAELAKTGSGALANALIESFCVHARALMDFYRSSSTKPDDVVATDFTSSRQFSAPNTAQIPSDIRERVNKQIAHLTAGRETPLKKVDSADRQALITAIEADHTAFKGVVDSNYVNCFTGEQTPTVVVTGVVPASATNSILSVSSGP